MLEFELTKNRRHYIKQDGEYLKQKSLGKVKNVSFKGYWPDEPKYVDNFQTEIYENAVEYLSYSGIEITDAEKDQLKDFFVNGVKETIIEFEGFMDLEKKYLDLKSKFDVKYR